MGMNLVWFLPSFVTHVSVVEPGKPPTPPSPEANSTDVPRAPSENPLGRQSTIWEWHMAGVRTKLSKSLAYAMRIVFGYCTEVSLKN
jgi:hypothetical protein